MLRKRLLTVLRNAAGSGADGNRRLSTGATTAKGRLEGKVAVITGGASGIGRATAKEFAANGARVVIADMVPAEVGQKVAEEEGDSVSFVRCNVRNETEVAEAVRAAVRMHGAMDIMYNNAGIPGVTSAQSMSVSEMSMDEFDEVMGVNVRGVVAGMKHAARAMIERGTGGCILCTGSITGLIGGVAPLPYSISKFCIPGVVVSAAASLARHSIRVNAISPFAVATPFSLRDLRTFYPALSDDELAEILHSAGELKGPRCTAADVAKAALYLASDDGRYVTGHNLVVDGGFSVIKPFRLPHPSSSAA
eukprot:TRINITY_DN20912_c0_g1_i2.p1 TRINITY_DN20912_c0_g1~~TRINITY_DN20912_c0_g1_i2.p1  ORF type:complete len:307 (+),score=-32.01 TRINITY_DN20912_c0_g1_i2:351-1271(+)